MFFYIGDNCPLTALKQVEPRLFLDDGWNHKSGIWYKGYSTECVLEDSVYDIVNGYQPAGKWCVICADEVYHPVLRGFPVYIQDKSRTNIKLDGFDWGEYNCLPPPEKSTPLSLDDAATMIGDVLRENVENFYRYNYPTNMTALVSAGLDTTTVWAIIDSFTKDFEVSLYLPTENDIGVLKYLGTRRDYSSDLMDKVSEDCWGYYHACFYKEPNWNITGYYAEVYTYRDGEAINALANYQGKKIHELANEEDYLYWFLKRPNIVEKYKDSQMEFNNEDELRTFLWATIWYDHQMWHLDNNLMFSPFADIRIPEIVHRMSIEDITKNSVTGIIQRKIIERFKPELLSILSDYKNEKDIYKNFITNFDPTTMIDPNTKLIYR